MNHPRHIKQLSGGPTTCPYVASPAMAAKVNYRRQQIRGFCLPAKKQLGSMVVSTVTILNEETILNQTIHASQERTESRVYTPVRDFVDIGTIPLAFLFSLSFGDIAWRRAPWAQNS